MNANCQGMAVQTKQLRTGLDRSGLVRAGPGVSNARKNILTNGQDAQQRPLAARNSTSVVTFMRNRSLLLCAFVNNIPPLLLLLSSLFKIPLYTFGYSSVGFSLVTFCAGLPRPLSFILCASHMCNSCVTRRRGGWHYYIFLLARCIRPHFTLFRRH